jgi:Ser/Thr protein kinase RdoA (MazF antagonist)
VQWDDPRVVAALPADARTTVAALLAARGRLLHRLDSLPAAFSHFDAHPGNLFTRRAAGEPHRTQRTIAIDWALAGPGPLGHEPAQVVCASLLASRFDAHEAAALEDAVLTGYAEGLREAGAGAALDAVRWGYAAAAALHWGTTIPVLVGRFQTEPGLLAEWSRQWGRPEDALLRQWSALARYALSLAAEALAT